MASAKPENKLGLPPGMKEGTFVNAVKASGYPLQLLVAEALSDRGFDLEEEWAYLDKDEDVRRTVDVSGLLPRQGGPVESERGFVRLSVALIIECKLSRHPYVFFESVRPPSLMDFPDVVGLGSGLVELRPPQGPPRRPYVGIARVLGSGSNPFVGTPPVASSLSRAVPKGESVQLSGDEPYNSLLLPLTKALAQYQREWRGERQEDLVGKPTTTFEFPSHLLWWTRR